MVGVRGTKAKSMGVWGLFLGFSRLMGDFLGREREPMDERMDSVIEIFDRELDVQDIYLL